MNKLNLSLIVGILISSSASGASMRRLQKRLSKSLNTEIKINNQLMRNKETCTRKLLESWSGWWKNVESPYKEQYIKSLRKINSIDISRSNAVQKIEGEYKSVYLVKQVCTGGILGRSCSIQDSINLKLQKNVTLNGRTPRFEMILSPNTKIYLEFAEDWSSEKRYDTFKRVIFENLERNNNLFDRYLRSGQIGQVVRPGTDSTLKKHCAFPRLDQIFSKLQ